MTVINNINTLGVETIGQEESTKVSLQRGANSKQVETEVEIINNNENAVQNVKALGTFPTKNSQNNIDTKITKEQMVQKYIIQKMKMQQMIYRTLKMDGNNQ